MSIQLFYRQNVDSTRDTIAQIQLSDKTWVASLYLIFTRLFWSLRRIM